MIPSVTPILPGAIIGMLGSGQLGRMFALAARRMGYRIQTFSPDSNSPTGQIADREVVADYLDLDAVREFARGVHVVTFEFENVPSATTEAVADYVPVRPGGHVLHIAQNRLREKTFFAAHGLPHTPFRSVGTEEELAVAVAELGSRAILKTAGFGYDGKGQWRLDTAAMASEAWAALGGEPAVLEAFVDFDREISVIGARGVDGAMVCYPPIQNAHRNGILDVSLCPVADLSYAILQQAREITETVLETLEVVGVLCVEFFLTTDGRLLINEIAPRPHNSGHLTIEACATSQFEQQLRTVCGLPLGSTDLLGPAAAMSNLLGDLWTARSEPNWAAACAIPGVNLHLYGKEEARPGRKMGHLTALGELSEDAERIVRRARVALTPSY